MAYVRAQTGGLWDASNFVHICLPWILPCLRSWSSSNHSGNRVQMQSKSRPSKCRAKHGSRPRLAIFASQQIHLNTAVSRIHALGKTQQDGNKTSSDRCENGIAQRNRAIGLSSTQYLLKRICGGLDHKAPRVIFASMGMSRNEGNARRGLHTYYTDRGSRWGQA